MRKESYYKIAPIKIVDGQLDELKVSVDYSKGGRNYFNGRMDRRGVYVYLTPIHREANVTRSIMFGGVQESGFKVFVKETSRLSQKQIDNVAEVVFSMGEQIAELYNKQAYSSISSLILSKCK